MTNTDMEGLQEPMGRDSFDHLESDTMEVLPHIKALGGLDRLLEADETRERVGPFSNMLLPLDEGFREALVTDLRLILLARLEDRFTHLMEQYAPLVARAPTLTLTSVSASRALGDDTPRIYADGGGILLPGGPVQARFCGFDILHIRGPYSRLLIVAGDKERTFWALPTRKNFAADPENVNI